MPAFPVQDANDGTWGTDLRSFFSPSFDLANNAFNIAQPVLFAADNLYDVGASGSSRPRDLFIGRDVNISGIGSPLKISSDAANPLSIKKSTLSVVAPGASFATLRWENGTNAGTLKLVAYSGTSITGVTVVDNVGAGN